MPADRSAPRAHVVRASTLAVLAGAAGVLSVSLAARRSVPRTTYASTSATLHLLDVVAGLSCLAAGVIACWARPYRSLGPVTAGVGIAWFAADWVGWDGGRSVVRSVGMVVVPFAAPLLAHVALAAPVGVRVRSTRGLVVVGSYALTALASVGRALFRDPFLDRYCWSNCTDNAFLVHADRQLATWFDAFGLRVAVVVGLVGTVGSAGRMWRGTSVFRRSSWPIVVPAAVASLAAAAFAATRIWIPLERPEHDAYAALFVVRAVSVVALAGGVAWGVVRTARTSRGVRRLADVLGDVPRPGSLQRSLATSLADDTLKVAYWLPDTETFADVDGHVVESRTGRGQATTTIVRGGRPVALVIHDEALLADHHLEREIGATASLAIDNERLHADVLRRLGDLRESRARIVSSADAERRRIERDLHDGAQQRLLAVLFELRLASSAAAKRGDADLVESLRVASDDAARVITELRELAHGIYPAILTEAGLGPALRTLADRAGVPVAVEIGSDRRFGAGIEAAAYLVAAETISAVGMTATYAEIGLEDRGSEIVVAVDHDGATLRGDVVVHLHDRVGAIGGTVGVSGTSVRAEIPCVS